MRLIILVLFAASLALRAEPVELLWPTGAPGALGTADVDKPSMTLFPATGSKVNGSAVVICPGGGYQGLSMDLEGYSVAKWINTLGVSAFVLKSRLGPTYHHPIEMNDAQRAMRWVRANAARFHIDVDRVGIIGFSAGGHLAATVSTHYDFGMPGAADSIDRYKCRPDFSILGYPVITMDASFTHAGSRTNLLGNSPSQALVDLLSNEKQVDAQTPPAFLFHAKDDPGVPYKNSQVYRDSLAKWGISNRLKLFEKGGHGFGMANGTGGSANDSILSTWSTLAGVWMGEQGFLQMPTAVISISPRPSHTRAHTGLVTESPSWNQAYGPVYFDATGRRLWPEIFPLPD